MTERSDGSTASYYELPPGATQLQDLISHRDMNAQIGEIFRACYRMGLAEHSDRLRDAKKILFYAKAEVERLEKLQEKTTTSPVVSVLEQSCATVKKLALEQEELSDAVAEVIHVLGIHKASTLSEKAKSVLGRLLKESL